MKGKFHGRKAMEEIIKEEDCTKAEVFKISDQEGKKEFLSIGNTTYKGLRVKV